MRSMPRVDVLVVGRVVAGASAREHRDRRPVSASPRRVPSSPCSSSTASRALDSIAESDGGRGIRILREHPSRGARLHADHRDVVRDDVVQLAGDAQPLDRDGLGARALALGGELGGALLELGARPRRAVGGVAEVPRAAEVEQVREHVDEAVREVRRERALAGEVGQVVLHGRVEDERPRTATRTCRRR